MHRTRGWRRVSQIAQPEEKSVGFKTIATVLTDPARSAPQLQNAAALAEAHGAHLEVVCAGIDYSRPDMAFPEAMPALDQAALGSARDDVRALEELVSRTMTAYSAPWETRGFVVTQAGLARTVAETTQLVDLTVLPRPYGPQTTTLDETVAEAALFNGPSPVLFAQAVDVEKLRDGPVLVGWNETPESLAAIRAALPLLQNASTVHITMVSPRKGGLERSDPGGALARFLVRHGCRVEVAVLAQTLPRASDELLRHARETSSELMVLGAYGHSRLREAVFGGATRNLLGSSEIPLFMAR